MWEELFGVMDGSVTFNCVKSALLILLVEVTQILAHDQSQLDLIVHRDAIGTQHRSFVLQKDRTRRFEEEKWPFGSLVVEFFYVVAVGIVSSSQLGEFNYSEERGVKCNVLRIITT
jgi:hypothetical protein